MEPDTTGSELINTLLTLLRVALHIPTFHQAYSVWLSVSGTKESAQDVQALARVLLEKFVYLDAVARA